MMRIVDACESCGLPLFRFHPGSDHARAAGVDKPPRTYAQQLRARGRDRSVDNVENPDHPQAATVTHRPKLFRAPPVSHGGAYVTDVWRLRAPLDKLALVPAIHIFAIGVGG